MVVKYNGDILKLEILLGVSVEILGYNYAIITADSQEQIKRLLDYSEIEYIEKPFILETQDTQSFSSTGITKFKQNNNLTGKGTILGIIDSGIDYNLPVFRDRDGNSKILYYWDQSIPGNPPEGFKEGSLYTNEDINKAISGEIKIPIPITSTHGTHVSGICAEIANDASIIFVRVGSRVTDSFSKSTEFMRAIKFVLDRALELKMPVAINISYGSNEGSHSGLSLFEQYIDEMCDFWKNNIVIAAGNNGDKGGHKNINIKSNNNEEVEVEFVVGPSEKILNINIWPDFTDDFSVHLISPSNLQTQPISRESGEVKNIIGRTKIKGYFYPITPYSLIRRVTIQMSSNNSITPGIWKIVFTPIKVITGNIDIYLPTSEGLSRDTRFLVPDSVRTVTVPGTATKPITVGSYNSRTDNVSIFSGSGDIENGMYKPDILAPGEDIVSVLPGGNTGALTGTSMATPHVTGSVALLMEWGIVKRNDLYLYSQKMKALLIQYARRNPNYTYPDNSRGYGFLDLANINLNTVFEEIPEDILFRKSKKKNRIRVENEFEGLYPTLNVVHRPGFEEELKNLNTSYKYYKIADDFGVIYTKNQNLRYLDNVLNLRSVIRAQRNVFLAPLGEVSQGTSGGVVTNEEIGANFFKNNPNISITGRGVIIGIADSGIDYLHEDFIYPDGTSKIVYLWDQTKDGNPPKGYAIGTEYTREDINKAIAAKDDSLSKDEEGTGTMISGICAGLGNVNKEYAGVAEEAELIVIKLKKLNGFYNNGPLFAAVNYIEEKTYRSNIAGVVNLSIGSNSMLGLSARVLAEKYFFKRGVCTVTGVGNEGNTQTHAIGNINFNGEIKIIELELAEDEKEIYIEFWVDRPDKINVAVITPTGEPSKEIDVSNFGLVDGLFDLEGTKYVIAYTYPTSDSGQQLTIIRLINAKKGIWKIKLTGKYITNGRYNAYLQNRVFLKPGTKFTQTDPSYTVNFTAVYEDVVSVGAYDTINSSIWPTSSRGPSISGLSKPDLVAPGVNIIAPYPGNKYAKLTGTAAAGAHVSGAVALFLQYILVDGNYPDKAFVQKIRTYLGAGAKRESQIVYPNQSYGYGELDIRGMFDQLK